VIRHVAMSFSLNLKVRDYECDMQGIVNNAIYQHYLEHARHEYLLSRGLSFAEMTRQGVFIVVVRADLDYRKSLQAGDEFQVTVKAVRPTPVRLLFEQSILLERDAPAILRARITCTAVNDAGRPYFPAQFADLIDG
jgi:acyl-CoA thioester hydrolase